jgi:hypothetical protein
MRSGFRFSTLLYICTVLGFLGCAILVRGDALVAFDPHFIGLRQISFVPHDEAPMNFRSVPFSRKSWIMLLRYTLDFKDFDSTTQACAMFARVLHWNFDETSLSRVLLKVLIEDPLVVPKSLVIMLVREADDHGRSWTVPVYIFNSEIVQDGPVDEEDPPANNGNPHPYQGPMVLREEEFVVQMAEHFMENLPQINQNMQVSDQVSNAESVPPGSQSGPVYHSFAQGPNQEVQIIFPLPAQ